MSPALDFPYNLNNELTKEHNWVVAIALVTFGIIAFLGILITRH